MLIAALLTYFVFALAISAIHCAIVQTDQWQDALAYFIIAPALLIYYMWGAIYLTVHKNIN